MSAHFELFQTQSGNTYLYDSLTSSIHSWNPPLDVAFTDRLYKIKYEDIPLLPFPDKKEKEHLLLYLRLWRKKTGAFRNPPKTTIANFHSFEEIPLDKKGPVWMSDLVITASEGCNLRCAYCNYSSYYSSYRTHNKNLISLEIAQKAIDWFFHYNEDSVFHSYPGRNLNIVYYGGEPFLNYEVVQKAITYAEKTKKDHYGLVQSISTNLTLLKKEYLPFLKKHKIFINVSLDGPAEEHNRYRNFVNGHPTFNRVIRNLNTIRDFDEGYYFERVRLLPTLNGNSNAMAVYQFFDKNKMDLPPFMMVNFMKDLSFCDFHKDFPFNEKEFLQQVADVLNIYMDQKLQGRQFKQGEFFYHFVDDALNNIYQRIHAYGKTFPTWFTGTCLPGRKLAASPDGTFHICERINSCFPIGDVEHGMNETKALEIINKYFQNADQCQECWARNLCPICFAAVCEKGYFDFNHRCEAARENTKANLGFLYSILDKKQNAFYAKDRIICPDQDLS